MSTRHAQSVYVAKNGDGPHKIGISSNLEVRKTDLKSFARHPVEFVAVHPRPTGDARLIEKAAHFALEAKRHAGEWFDVSIDEAVRTVMEVIAAVDAGEITDSTLSRAKSEALSGADVRSERIGIRISNTVKAQADVARGHLSLSKWVEVLIVEALKRGSRK